MQVKAVDEVVRTMKDNLNKVDNIVKEWDKPLMERKPKPVEKDEFDRMQKGVSLRILSHLICAPIC